MSAFHTIALIGFGEVGQRLAGDLLAAGAQVRAFDILFEQGTSIPARALAEIPVQAAMNAADAVRNAELVISAVTPASDLEVAHGAAPALAEGAFFLDLNSASPGMKQASAQAVAEAQGRYVEAAVMTPIASKGIASYMLLGGPHAAAFMEHGRPLGFTGEIFSDTVGPASATKMCRSVVIKGMEALLSESLVTARRFGVEKTVLNSLSDLLPLPDWEKTAHYMISRALEHGVRRGEEMREVAKTVAEAGLEPHMSMATARRQDWAAAQKTAFAPGDDLAALLDALTKNIEHRKRGSAA